MLNEKETEPRLCPLWFIRYIFGHELVTLTTGVSENMNCNENRLPTLASRVLADVYNHGIFLLNRIMFIPSLVQLGVTQRNRII